MPYSFSFDLTQLSRSFFIELARISEKNGLHRRLGDRARHLVKKFKIAELTGLDLENAFKVIEDIVDIYVTNLAQKNKFTKSWRRAILLPHCSRKNMDNKCWAKFNPEISSYSCGHC